LVWEMIRAESAKFQAGA